TRRPLQRLEAVRGFLALCSELLGQSLRVGLGLGRPRFELLDLRLLVGDLGLNASPKLLQAPSARRLRRSCFLRQLSELGAPSLQAALVLLPQVGQSLVILALNLRPLGFGIRLRLVELGGPFREVLLDLPPALITPCHGPPSNGSSSVRAVDRQPADLRTRFNLEGTAARSSRGGPLCKRLILIEISRVRYLAISQRCKIPDTRCAHAPPK